MAAMPSLHDRAVDDLFRHIQDTSGKLDILVNVAWGGYERMVEDGKFTFIAPFWEQPARGGGTR